MYAAHCDELCANAHELGIPVHLDGARIFNASAAQIRALRNFQKALIRYSFVYQKVWVLQLVRCCLGRKILLMKQESGESVLAAECVKSVF